MIGIFKQKAPTNALLLFVYALVLKFPIFLHPYSPLLYPEDNYLYRFILTGLDSLFGHSALLFAVLSFTLLFTQATLLNSICNFHKILPKSTYLTGMSYILVTSLLPDWGHFSAPLLINSIIIWCWYRMIALYNSPSPVAAIFNISLFLGLATLLYIPAIAFLLLLFFALLIMRPFRIQEWFVGFIGFTSPYYFLILILYFVHQLNWKNLVPSIHFALPPIPGSIWITAGISMLIIPFVVGGIFVQNNLNKMLIHVRKSWSLLLVFLIAAVLVILIYKAGSYENWIVMAMPFAVFHSAAWFYPTKKWPPVLLHWICFSVAIVVNYLL
ncbi:MAG: DUF6427 family protein [Bacteroidota bacterium]|nr:DUF6427 family protein [Bacteroidota bacterium]MDP4211228.1 DUF6427 family protein [Bacteroidota bacterium]MDP4251136.1 DUF6427 family protein [Bacteroidota bacterium]